MIFRKRWANANRRALAGQEARWLALRRRRAFLLRLEASGRHKAWDVVRGIAAAALSPSRSCALDKPTARASRDHTPASDAADWRCRPTAAERHRNRDIAPRPLFHLCRAKFCRLAPLPQARYVSSMPATFGSVMHDALHAFVAGHPDGTRARPRRGASALTGYRSRGVRVPHWTILIFKSISAGRWW